MRSLLPTLTRLALCAALTAGFSACGGGEDPEDPVDQGPNEEDPNEEDPKFDLSTCTLIDADFAYPGEYAEGCYHVTSSVDHRSDGKITINAGAVFYVDGAAVRFEADELEIVGTEAAPVKFLNAPDKAWTGLTLFGRSVTVNHAVIEGVDASVEQAVMAPSGMMETLDFQHVTFRNNESRDCLYYTPYVATLTLEHVKFGCALGTVWVEAVKADKLSETLDFNGLPIVLFGGDQRESVTLKKLATHYIVHGGLSFKQSTTIEAGVEIIVNSKSAIEFMRTHTLDGTAEEPIVLRAGDGDKWAGVLVNSANASGSFNYVHIVGAGTNLVRDEPATNIRVTSSGRATLRNCELRDSTGYAGIKDPSGTINADSSNKYIGNRHDEIRGL